MSYCREEGKDKLIFTSQEELDEPSKDAVRYLDVMVKGLNDDVVEPEGFVQKNGELNFGCSCLGTLAIGPCAVEFREFQNCLHSKGEDEITECLEQWNELSSCFKDNPELYFKKDDSKSEGEKRNESDSKPDSEVVSDSNKTKAS